MTNKHLKYRPPDPEVTALADQFKRQPEAVLEILQSLQAQEGGLTPTKIEAVGRSLAIPAERAYGIASFYSLLSITPEGEAPVKQPAIRVCDGPVCWLKRANEVQSAVSAQLSGDWKVERSSCLGLCDHAPAALVGERQAGPLDPDQIESLPTSQRDPSIQYALPRPGELRVMLAQTGKIDPTSLTAARAYGAYRGLARALEMSPEEVLSEVENSGLTGRGGAGFPVGRKWRFVASAHRKPKYVICNADESEPLIFKDRVLIETNPHQVLEGMAIAGYATGASEAFIYIRGEYEDQARLLEHSIHQAEKAGLLGEGILGSEYTFHIHVHRGAGAYICGEETALIESLEGKRGEPRFRPPYPPSYGYMGLPTLVNNVESYAAVPAILHNGADWYRSISTHQTPGTKLYMVLGHINKPGLFEAPFGLTLRQIIHEYGSGMRSGSEFQFALCGGAAGTIAAEANLDIPIDYASGQQGVSLGAGSFLICDQSISPVAFLRELLHFFAAESCGKCTPCRVGTCQSLDILNRLSGNAGLPGDVDQLLALAQVLQTASLCGLGQSVALPVKSALNHFRAQFIHAENPAT